MSTPLNACIIQVSFGEAGNNNWEKMCAFAKEAIHPQVAVFSRFDWTFNILSTRGLSVKDRTLVHFLLFFLPFSSSFLTGFFPLFSRPFL